MKIELIDLKKRYKEEREELLSIFDRVLKNGSLILTDEVKNFEKKICDYTNSKYCLGLNSGTDALMMALWSIGIKRGDEILVPALTIYSAKIDILLHPESVPRFVTTPVEYSEMSPCV